MNILLLDNYDSFTHNLAQQMGKIGATVTVKKNDQVSIADIQTMRPDKIVISPGPGNPSESGLSLEIIQKFHTQIPILGVCLGHQCLAAVFDSPQSVIRAPKVMHGKTSKIFHDGKSLMKNVPSPFLAARYHSLIIQSVPKDFDLLCWTGSQKKPDVIMGIRHKNLPIFGVQFHPESFLTEHGDMIMRNFLSL